MFECFDCKKRYTRKVDKKLTKKFKNTYNFCNGDIDKFMLLLRKGIYPYEYMDDWSGFDEEQLPDENDFYSGLKMEEISDIDYRHAEKDFNKFNINHLGKYHDLYVQSDTLLLADVFENFRNMCIKVYGLDPAYFLSAPGLAWQACLKKTGVKLELITDADMLLMIEKGIRGGICHSVYRHAKAKANNKYMKIYDKNNESSYIIYMDANNVYGYAMSKRLPVDGFEWVEDDKDSDVGYFIEADVEYPKELHTLHSDLPFLPERMEANKCKKLICSLYDKKNYVDHISSLKQALNHGLILKKVHRVIKFNQRSWLKEYIDMNTEYRMNAKNDFEKDFYKLMNNAVFGKTMENVRKHREIK